MVSSAVMAGAVSAERPDGDARLLRDAAWVRFCRPDLTAGLADHVLSVAVALRERDLWLAAAGWMVNGRAAIGDGRDAASDVLDHLGGWADGSPGNPLDADAARRLRVELAAAAVGAGQQVTARALLVPCVDDADPELRADALIVLARCAMEDARDDVGRLLDGALRAWSETEPDRARVGTAVVALLAATVDRRDGRPGPAADRAVEGLTSLDRCRVTPDGPSPSGHLAAALATEWITALLDAERIDDAREAAAAVTPRLVEPVRTSRQLARLRLTVVRAAGTRHCDAAVAEMERAAQDAADSDAPDLDAVCRIAIGELHESAGRFEDALASLRLAAAAESRDRARAHRLRDRLAGLRVPSEQRRERPGRRGAGPAPLPVQPERAAAAPPPVTELLPLAAIRAAAGSDDGAEAPSHGSDAVTPAVGTAATPGRVCEAAGNGGALLGEALLHELRKVGWWTDGAASGGPPATGSASRGERTPGGTSNSGRSEPAHVPVTEAPAPVGPSRAPTEPSTGEAGHGMSRRASSGAVRGATAPPGVAAGDLHPPHGSGRPEEHVEDTARDPAERPAPGRVRSGGVRGRDVSADRDERQAADRAAGSSIATPSTGTPTARVDSGRADPAASPSIGLFTAAVPGSVSPAPPPPTPPSAAGRPGPSQDWLAKTIADLYRVPAPPAAGTPPAGAVAMTGSARPGGTASADGDHRPGGAAIGAPKMPTSRAEGSVATFDLAVEGRRVSGQSAVDAARTIRTRLVERLPAGGRLRDDRPDAVSLVLPRWARGAVVDWLHRVLPSLAEGLLADRVTTGVQLRAVVHDSQGLAGAQLLQRLDRLVPCDRAGGAAESSRPEVSGPIRGDQPADSAGQSRRVDAAATTGPLGAVPQCAVPEGAVTDPGEPAGSAAPPTPAGAPPLAATTGTGPWPTAGDDIASGEARSPSPAGNRHDAMSGGHLFRPDGQEVRPGSGGRRHRRGPDGRVPGVDPGASSAGVAGAPDEDLSLAELLARALAAYRGI